MSRRHTRPGQRRRYRRGVSWRRRRYYASGGVIPAPPEGSDRVPVVLSGCWHGNPHAGLDELRAPLNAAQRRRPWWRRLLRRR